MDKNRALILDDFSVMRTIVERSLREAGVDLEQVSEASNGTEALAVLESAAVDGHALPETASTAEESPTAPVTPKAATWTPAIVYAGRSAKPSPVVALKPSVFTNAGGAYSANSIQSAVSIGTLEYGAISLKPIRR